MVTETERTTQHEVYENESLPDSGSSLSDGSVHEEARETQHNIVHTKDEDLVEYYGVPRGGTLAQGVKVRKGCLVTLCASVCLGFLLSFSAGGTECLGLYLSVP